MDAHLKESLRLIEELLNTLDDNVFYEQYLSFERYNGPTIDEFIESIGFLYITSIELEKCSNDNVYFVSQDSCIYSLAA